MSEPNAVQAAIRDDVDARYAAWRIDAADPFPTRAGARYRGFDVARLLGPALEAVGLHVWEDLTEVVFVSPAGRQLTRERLRELIVGALEGHEDDVLRASVGTRQFWEYLAGQVPYYEGETIERSYRRSPAVLANSAAARKARREADERASARAWLEVLAAKRPGETYASRELYDAARAQIAAKVREGREGYGSPFLGDEDGPRWAVPGKRLFYKVADEVLGERRRTSRGYFFSIAQAVRTVVRRIMWRDRSRSAELDDMLREIGQKAKEARPRLARRDRPLDAETEAALRGIAVAARSGEVAE